MKKSILNNCLLTLLSTCFLISCSFNNPISNLWFYTYSNYSSNEKDTTLNPACFINLQKDGTYTRDFGFFDYGKWAFSNNKLRLTNYKNEIDTIRVNSVSVNELQLGFHIWQTDNFESQPGTFSLVNSNPFSKENNLWRMPADKKETEAEITNRLLNHFKFWEVYFTWALNNKIESIDVRSTPTLIKIYGNGFTLKPFNELPKEWKSFFIMKMIAGKQATNCKLLENNDVAWPHTENKYEMFISVFQQLEQKFK